MLWLTVYGGCEPRMPSAIYCLGQEGAELLKVLLVGVVEGGEFGAVDVEHTDDFRHIIIYRHYDFGARETAACYVSREFFYVGNDECLTLLPCTAAHSASEWYLIACG